MCPRIYGGLQTSPPGGTDGFAVHRVSRSCPAEEAFQTAPELFDTGKVFITLRLKNTPASMLSGARHLEIDSSSNLRFSKGNPQPLADWDHIYWSKSKLTSLLMHCNSDMGTEKCSLLITRAVSETHKYLLCSSTLHQLSQTTEHNCITAGCVSKMQLRGFVGVGGRSPVWGYALRVHTRMDTRRMCL